MEFMDAVKISDAEETVWKAGIRTAICATIQM